jgi:hypothetical protein
MPGGQARMSGSPPQRRSRRRAHSRLTACPAHHAGRPPAVVGGGTRLRRIHNAGRPRAHKGSTSRVPRSETCSGPPLPVPLPKLVPPARVGKPPRRSGPLPPCRHWLRRRRWQHTASPVSEDRSSQQQAEGSGDRQDHRTKDGRADTRPRNIRLYASGLSLGLEQERAGLLDPEGGGMRRPPGKC